MIFMKLRLILENNKRYGDGLLCTLKKDYYIEGVQQQLVRIGCSTFTIALGFKWWYYKVVLE